MKGAVDCPQIHPGWARTARFPHEDRVISGGVSILSESWSIPEIVENDIVALTATPFCIELRALSGPLVSIIFVTMDGLNEYCHKSF
jgi:hypothetical protein